MSSKDEAGAFDAMREWLLSSAEGTSLFARFAADPEGVSAALTEWLEVHADTAPAQLSTHVSGGQIGHLVNIARAGVVILGEPRLGAPLQNRFDHIIRRHCLFGGRDSELQRLESIRARGRGYLLLTGNSGTGKTALLANWVDMLRSQRAGVAYAFLSRQDGLADEDFVLRALCEQLANFHNRRGALPLTSGELRALFPTLLRSPAPPERLVVVVDGLDEALGWTLGADLFPPDLADNIVVVLSARTIAGRDWPQSLGLRGADVELRELGPLWPPQVADLLRAAGGQAATWASEAEFVDAVHTVSDGDPFYLRFLVSDIADGTIGSLAGLKRQPSQLDGYLRTWWSELSGASRDEAAKTLLGFLLIARGPIAREDLVAIDQSDALDSWVFDDALSRVERYVTSVDGYGMALSHPRFRDFLAQGPISQGEQQAIRGRVLHYCARWRDTGSAYALRHYAGHLSELGERERLLELAQDPAFAGAQVARLPGEHGLPLRTTQIALDEAAASDDASGVAALLLAYALRRAHTAAMRTPIDELDANGIEPALQLADLYGPEFSALWHLLVAWQVSAEGLRHEALVPMERLLRKVTPPFSGWDVTPLLPLFIHAALIDAESGVELARRLLDDDALFDLASALADRHAGDQARAVASVIDDDWTRADAIGRLAFSPGSSFPLLTLAGAAVANLAARAWVLARIGVAASRRGDNAVATGSLKAAHRAVGAAEVASEKATVLAFIANAEQSVGSGDAAKETRAQAQAVADQIDDDEERAEVLSKISPTGASAGEAGEAADRGAPELDGAPEDDTVTAAVNLAVQGEVSKAISVADSASDERSTILVLSAVSAALEQAGDEAAARRLFARTLAAAAGLEDEQFRWEVEEDGSRTLAGIAELLATAEEYDAASKMSAAIPDLEQRVRAFVALGQAQAAAGLTAEGDCSFAAAAHAAADIEDGWIALPDSGPAWRAIGTQRVFGMRRQRSRDLTLGDVVGAQIGAGALASAATTAGAIAKPTAKAIAFVQLARAYHRKGDEKRAADAQLHAAQAWLERGLPVPREVVNYHLTAGDYVEAAAAASRLGDPSERDQAFGLIAEAQAVNGDFAAATETADLIGDELRPEVLTSIVDTALRLDALAAAKDAASSIDDPWYRGLAYATVAHAYAAAGRSLKARLALAEATEAAQGLQTLEDWLGWFEVEVAISKALSRMGSAEEALDLLQSTIAVAISLEDDEERGDALSSLAVAEAELWHFDGALVTAQAIGDVHFQSTALGQIAAAQAAAGRAADALRTASSIAVEREANLLPIAQAFADAQNRAGFMHLVPQCVGGITLAFQMVQILAGLSPRHESEIATQVTTAIRLYATKPG